MAERGTYRALHTVLVDDPDFQDLSPDAKLIFYTGRLQLGPTGIGVLYVAALAEQTGMPLERVRQGMGELMREGWIEWQRNIVWFVNGLHFEPSLSLNNEKHLTSIRNHLSGLPKLSIVNKFAAHYELDAPFDSPPDTHWHTPSDGGAVHGVTEDGRTEEGNTEGSEGSSLRSSPSGEDADVENPPEDEGESWNDQLAPVVREVAYLGTGPPEDWSLGRCMSRLKQLKDQGYSTRELEDGLRGLRWMVEREHEAICDKEGTPFIRQGQKFRAVVFNRAEERGMPLLSTAAHQWRKHGEPSANGRSGDLSRATA